MTGDHRLSSEFLHRGVAAAGRHLSEESAKKYAGLEARTETGRLQRRIFMLCGWGRWLAHRAPQLREEMDAIRSERGRRGIGLRAGARGNWGIVVEGDACARAFQQRLRRLHRAASVFSGKTVDYQLENAREARALEKDVRLYLRPCGDDGDLWDDEVRWWCAPEACYSTQSTDDGSWSLVGLSSKEIRESRLVCNPPQEEPRCEWPDCTCPPDALGSECPLN